MTLANHFTLTVDLKKNIAISSGVPALIQYDAASMSIKILDNGKPYEYGDDIERYVFNFKLPSGEKINGLGTYNSETNTIDYNFGMSEMSEIGTLECSVALYLSEKRLTSRSFAIKIIESLENNNPSEEGITLIQELFIEVSNVKNSAETATINANNAANKINDFNFKGSFSSGTSYKQNNVISYGGVNYLCIQNSTGNLPTDSSYWQQIAPKTTIRDQSWISTGQTTFTLTNGSYAVGTRGIEVWVGGVLQANGTNFTESSETTISFFEPITSGLTVYARWNEGTLSIINRTAVATNITSIPQFLGQIAVVGSIGYLATGTSSTSDWKQITN